MHITLTGIGVYKNGFGFQTFMIKNRPSVFAAMLSVSLFPLLAVVLLFTTRVQLASARGSSRDTTLATFNAALGEGFLAGVDSRVSVLIDQVRTENKLHLHLSFAHEAKRMRVLSLWSSRGTEQ